jgi:hypothetical protein
MLRRGGTDVPPRFVMVDLRVHRFSGPCERTILTALLIVVPGCESLPTGPAEGLPPAMRGITLVDWTAGGYAEPSAATAIASIRATGASQIAIIVTGYQSHAASSQVRADPARSPTPSSVRAAIDAAGRQGLGVVLKPHVDLEDGRWRGSIAPDDPARWFESYQQFLLPWADLAQAGGVETFVVGTELAGTLAHAEAWGQVIARVRKRFDGRILYAASWDEADRVPFWPDLDGVGVDVYVPVAARENPGRLEILARWQPWLARLERLHARARRPIYFTEIGYRSIDGAGMRPYDFQRRAPEDEAEQADLVWAALQAVAGKSWIKGVLWWDWRADGGGGPGDGDYTISGKLAAAELAAAWGAP